MRIAFRLLFAAIDFAVVYALLLRLDASAPLAFAVAAVSAVTTLAVLALAPRTTSEGLHRRWWAFVCAGILGLLFGTWGNEVVRAHPALAVAVVVLNLLMIGYGLHFRSLGGTSGGRGRVS